MSMSARIEYAPGEAWCIAVGRVVLVCERDLPAVRARALHDAAGVVDSVEALRTVLETATIPSADAAHLLGIQPESVRKLVRKATTFPSPVVTGRRRKSLRR